MDDDDSADPQSAALMQVVIASEYAQCTLLTVVHRLDNIRSFDKGVVLDAGEIVERGTPVGFLSLDLRSYVMYEAGGYH